jgi:hypothetical protein
MDPPFSDPLENLKASVAYARRGEYVLTPEAAREIAMRKLASDDEPTFDKIMRKAMLGDWTETEEPLDDYPEPPPPPVF